MQPLIFNPPKPGPKRALLLFVLPALLAMVFLFIFMKDLKVVGFFATVWVSIVLFLWGTWSKKVSVRLNAKGIFIRANGIGLIPWKEVTGFMLMKGGEMKVIAVEVSGPEELIASRGRLTRSIMRSNMQAGSPVLIPDSEFNIPIEEALAQIREFYDGLDEDENSEL
ncbi:MAG: STM3941 family protein [Bacteroidia bacterium]